MAVAGHKKMERPRIAVSLGDPDGVGPELARAAARSERVLDVCEPVLFPGGPLESLEAAVSAVERGECRALTTAPLSKERMGRLVPGFTGHTEWLAERAGLSPTDVVMIFSGPRVRTACVTRHVALGQVPSSLDASRIVRTTVMLRDHLDRGLGIEAPRIAVCGLNPHASESGLMGDEEERVIAPAVTRARGEVGPGEVVGPVAADAAFREHVLGRYDGVVAMYHDQATIAAKVVDPFRGVNVTAGLPWVRTSPDHGTADDIAGTGKADPTSMVEALVLAARLV
jgi:4-hydroxythreonine-4-phosphate dehydrogenase